MTGVLKMEIERSQMGLTSNVSSAEMSEEIPKEIKAAHKFLDEGDYKRAKVVANSIARINRQINLPGVDEEVKVLLEKIREKRTEAVKRKTSGTR
jgi:hypothetical protein